MAAGFRDLWRWALGWWSAGRDPRRPVDLLGDVQTAVPLEGDVGTAIDLVGDVRTAVSLEGDIMARHQPWDCFSGEDIVITDTVYDVDLTGETVVFVLKETPDATATLVSRSTGGSGVTLSYSSTTGDSTVTVTLTSSNTTLAAGTYYYAIARTTAGKKAVLSFGELIVSQSTALP